MNPELIVLLTASAQEINDIPAGKAQITSANIAGMLAKISPEAARYARLKWGGESHQSEELALYMRREVALWKGLERWRIPRPNFILDMCKLALNEAVSPNKCPYCKGQKYKKIDSRFPPCSKCSGSGIRRILADDRAEYMGIERSAWGHTWKGRHRRILAMPDGWESEVWAASM